jgi:hypothetical protein
MEWWQNINRSVYLHPIEINFALWIIKIGLLHAEFWQLRRFSQNLGIGYKALTDGTILLSSWLGRSTRDVRNALGYHTSTMYVPYPITHSSSLFPYPSSPSSITPLEFRDINRLWPLHWGHHEISHPQLPHSQYGGGTGGLISFVSIKYYTIGVPGYQQVMAFTLRSPWNQSPTIAPQSIRDINIMYASRDQQLFSHGNSSYVGGIVFLP